jgi:hypothetical protein
MEYGVWNEIEEFIQESESFMAFIEEFAFVATLLLATVSDSECKSNIRAIHQTLISIKAPVCLFE